MAAVVLFVIGTSLTLYLRRKDRLPKTFDYRVVSDTPIFTGHDRPADLKVSYKGIEVNDPRVTRIRFRNTGKRFIEATDFEEDYEIQRGGSGFLDYSVVESSTPGTELASITEIGVGTVGYIKFRPKSLNVGDWFTLQLIFDGGAGEDIKIKGRFKDWTRPTTIYPPGSDEAPTATGIYRPRVYWVYLTSAALACFGVFLGIYNLLRHLAANETMATVAAVTAGFGTLTAILFFSGLLREH